MKKIKSIIKSFKNKNNMTIKYILAIISLLVVVIPFTYSIFKSSVSANKSLIAATWSISLNGDENNELKMLPEPDGTPVSYNIVVTNQSQVDIVYDIVLENLPSGVSVSLDGGTYIPEDDGVATITNAGSIAYSILNNTQSHTLTFKAASSSTYVNNQEVNIKVLAKQRI